MFKWILWCGWCCTAVEFSNCQIILYIVHDVQKFLLCCQSTNEFDGVRRHRLSRIPRYGGALTNDSTLFYIHLDTKFETEMVVTRACYNRNQIHDMPRIMCWLNSNQNPHHPLRVLSITTIFVEAVQFNEDKTEVNTYCINDDISWRLTQCTALVSFIHWPRPNKMRTHQNKKMNTHTHTNINKQTYRCALVK